MLLSKLLRSCEIICCSMFCHVVRISFVVFVAICFVTTLLGEISLSDCPRASYGFVRFHPSLTINAFDILHSRAAWALSGSRAGRGDNLC